MMMAFFNMSAAGLKILATHRLVSGVDTERFVEAASRDFDVKEIASLDELKRLGGRRRSFHHRRGHRRQALPAHLPKARVEPMSACSERLLGQSLSITEEAVRDEKNLTISAASTPP